MAKRSKLNWAIFVGYVILHVAIPCILILWGTTLEDYMPIEMPEAGMVRLLLFFIVFPAYITYMVIVLRKVFPTEMKQALFIFIPYLANAIIYFRKTESVHEFFANWLAHGIPLFVGFMICSFIGLIILMIKHIPDLTWKDWAKPGCTILILFALFVPAGIVFMLGYHVSVGVLGKGIPDEWAIVMYFVSIAMVVGFYMPLLKKLYKEGEL